MVNTLFSIARKNAPSIIYIDEVSYLFQTGNDNESECSKQLKSELIKQMHGVNENNENIFLLGTTNVPWTLDVNILRIFQKRIYIPLPDHEARKQILKLHLNDTNNSLIEEHYEKLAELTEAYSGEDLKNLAKDTAMQSAIKLVSATHFKLVSSQEHNDCDKGQLLTPCSSDEKDAIPMSFADIPSDGFLEPIVSVEDVLRSLSSVKATIRKSELKKFCDFKMMTPETKLT